ncbi:MAG: GNAT family N-acetyltransferase, partial [Armatimonadota bacterium]
MEYHLTAFLFVLCGLAGIAVAAAPDDPGGNVVVRELRPADEFDHKLCRRLAGLSGLPKQHTVWPRLWSSLEDHGDRTLVGTVDGLVVGRAVLEAPYHPYCELVNLYVRPDYRGRGVATAIVRESIRRARGMGLKYMVLQEFGDSPGAHGIYEKAGFLRATVGEMQRLIHLLDVPLVSMLVQDHPDAEFVTEPAPELGECWWRLLWRSGDDYAALFLHGGSCQYDSDGFQPVVQACELARGEVGLEARADMVR